MSLGGNSTGCRQTVRGEPVEVIENRTNDFLMDEKLLPEEQISYAIRSLTATTMKTYMKTSYRLLIVISLLLHWGKQVTAQEEEISAPKEVVTILSAGVGDPELVNIGLGYRVDQLQGGLSFGSSMPATKAENIVSILCELRYYYGRLSDLSSKRPWYAAIGVNYTRDKMAYKIDKKIFANFRFGRDFDITNKLGVDIDVGAVLLIRETHSVTDTRAAPDLDPTFPEWISWGMGVFYRLY